MEKKYIASAFAIAIVALLGISMVSAYRGDPSVQGPNFSEERHDAMLQAFEDQNYDAWVELMTEDGRHPRIVDIITEENFSTFVELHEARLAQDTEKIAELSEELGLHNGIGPKDGTSFKRGNEMEGRKGMGMRQGSRDGSCLLE